MEDLLLQGLLPEWKKILVSCGGETAEQIEEIRIQGGQEVLFKSGGKEYHTKKRMTQNEVEELLAGMLSYSTYAHQEELSRGYVTLPGGHRVGVCGKAIVENGKIKGLKEISSLNIRRSREVEGCAAPVMHHIFSKLGSLETNKEGSIRNCLLVSPPGCGKTTLLRDIIRSLSEKGIRVAVVDERSEIAGMYRGRPQKNLGPRTDVLDGCMKSQGISMVIRAMGPQVVCCDEIGSIEDVKAVREALSSGVKVITTAHGDDFNRLKKSSIGALLSEEIFQRIIFLTNHPKVGTIDGIFDEKGVQIQ